MADEQASEKLKALLDGVRVAFLTTVATDGSLHGRPMALQELDPEGAVWFITALDSDKAREAEADQQVSVSCAKGSDRWVSVAGTARLVRDPARAKRLWNPFVEAWFPGGPSDPNVGLLRLHPQEAEYWESTSPKPVRYVQLLGAAVLQRPPDLGATGTLHLGHDAAPPH